ncbi:hypothetical protein Rruber_05625 (plasmid) [Rhodococcus ruber]
MNPMNVEDRRMLDFARIWAPYGGAQPDEIFVHFGMPPAQFYENISRILRTTAPGQISVAERQMLYGISARFCGAGVSSHRRRRAEPVRASRGG